MTTTRRKNSPRSKPQADPATETAGAEEVEENTTEVKAEEPETVDEEASADTDGNTPDDSAAAKSGTHTVTVKASAFSFRNGELSTVAFKGDTITVEQDVYERGLSLGAFTD